MMQRILCVSRSIVLILFFSAPPVFAATCESLAALKLAHTTITTAQAVAHGSFIPPPRSGVRGDGGAAFKNLPGFCRVAATLKPSTDSDIKIEVWMPASGWNGRLHSVGNGAWAGTISYPAMATALAAGYATASTDTGHTGNNADFIPEHPERVIDFSYRAVHEMTLAAKAIIGAHYGNSPQKGKAPNQIVASHMTGGKADRTRPLCPYPQVAAYKGTGSTDDAASFICK